MTFHVHSSDARPTRPGSLRWLGGRLAPRRSCRRPSGAAPIGSGTICLTVTRGHPLRLGPPYTPAGVNFVLLCRNGTRGLAGPLGAVQRRDRHRDPARPAEQPHRRPLAHPGRWSARRVLLRLSRRRARRAWATASTPASSCIDPASRALSCGRFWGAAGNAAPAQPGEPGDGRRPRRHQSAHPARGLDHLRAARARLHRRSQLRRAATPAPTPA